MEDASGLYYEGHGNCLQLISTLARRDKEEDTVHLNEIQLWGTNGKSRLLLDHFQHSVVSRFENCEVELHKLCQGRQVQSQDNKGWVGGLRFTYDNLCRQIYLKKIPLRQSPAHWQESSQKSPFSSWLRSSAVVDLFACSSSSRL
jgi:hypothetical protein